MQKEATMFQKLKHTHIIIGAVLLGAAGFISCQTKQMRQGNIERTPEVKTTALPPDSERKAKPSDKDFSAQRKFPAKKEMRQTFRRRGKSVGYGSMLDLASLSGQYNANFNTEGYDRIYENGFKNPRVDPLSTFSIDVDAASYANMRRFIRSNQMPPKDAVRIEEMINYFNYSYPEPDGKDPFSITTEMAAAPWNDSHQLVHIGLKGKSVDTKDLPPSNLVFLLDVSGSMNTPNKLPLLKSAFRLLVKQLRPRDSVAIVVYAGNAGLVLPATDGHEKDKILAALDRLHAGGSTAGGQGIQLAYKVAQENYLKKGNNRVILATDGDFNVGVTSNGDLTRLIEEKREAGVFLTVLGFGMGNYQDSKMEQLSNKGNGNYAYIDNILEAKKVLVSEIGGTLHTIAKDVKIQVEFNPQHVQAYRLIGYENRLLNAEDFNDDKKDAGELGLGHTVTALYEIVPHGIPFENGSVDALKYQMPTEKIGRTSGEILTVKFRYKAPRGTKSKLIKTTLLKEDRKFAKSSENFRFSSAVAWFGMVLRDSKHIEDKNLNEVAKIAKNSMGEDAEGYRAEFLSLVKTTQALGDLTLK